MKNLFSLILVSILLLNTQLSVFAADKKVKKDLKVRTYETVKKDPKTTATTSTTTKTTASTTTTQQELILVKVFNDFGHPIKVQLGGGRKVSIGSNEKAILGNRLPGKYTLTIFNENDEYVDTITKEIPGSGDKTTFTFNLNNDTVENDDRIDNLSTGQKVAIGAGIVGATAIGAALINMALNKNDGVTQPVPPPAPAQQVANQVVPPPPPAQVDNAFAPGGKALKVLNSKYDEVTLIVEGTDGNPIGSNWVISKAELFQRPKPLLFNGKEVKINNNQKVSLIIPGGYKLDRYAFELESDPLDGTYVWTVK